MTNPIDSLQRRGHAALDDAQQPMLRSVGPRELDVDALPTGHLDYGQLAARLHTATIAQTSSILSHASAAQAQLDAYRASFTPSYDVGGATVRASGQFRMHGGQNDANAGYDDAGAFHPNDPHVRELFSICARAHAAGAMHCLMGCPTASELAHVTQALIHAGKLPAGSGSVEARIKSMQWQWGIGIDCTDYVRGAALRASGKSSSQVSFQGLPSPATDYFQTADSNPHLHKVAIAAARPGDVFVLDAIGDVGHRAVVYSNTVGDAAKISSLASRYGAAVNAFAAGGSVRIVEVDASWSAGSSGAAWGGVRGDTWLYNESTHQWAQINQRVSPPTQPVFQVTPNGPANDVFHGAYRFQ